MVTQQLCYGLREVQALAERIGDADVAREAADLYATFSQRLNDVAWDGEWYIRTICEDGYRIGSKDNEEGQMFLNPQSWAVLSGIAPDDRAALCMRKVDELLAVDVGYRICTPAFAKYDPRVGRMSNTMPDTNENGGCYNHAAGFKGVADCLLGRAEQAWETFTKVAPDSPDNPVSNSQVEPFSFTNSYSTCKYIYGRAGYPWRTGTAGWFTMLLVEWILGARRYYDGLLVDPCLPKTMKHARVLRTFRGAQYDITIDNSAGRCTGTTSVSIDGMKMDDNVLPMFDTGLHAVEVVI
jgi:cellobiose phosphorylase